MEKRSASVAEGMGLSSSGCVSRREFLSMMAAATASLHAGGVLAAESAQVIGAQADQFLLPVSPVNPFYNWPRTLLAFPTAGDRELSMENHTLRCIETGSVLPFQVTRSGDAEGVRSILFLGDLPNGQTRTYELLAERAQASPSNGQAISITKEQKWLAIDSGGIRVRIPVSQNLSENIPGPILQVSRGGVWSGMSKLTVEGCRFTRLETVQIEGGPLRSIHRINYHSETGENYIATVVCVAGMDYVRLHEDMQALPADASGAFDFAWTGCEFSHRQGPNHPYNFPRHSLTDYSMYPWEKIAPAQMDTQFGVSPGLSSTGRVPFSLRLFEPWSDALAACFANFWSDSSPDAAAVFIDHMEAWEDHEYAIWHSSPRLAVEFVYAASTLHFVWKIARGSRSTCLCFYDHARDIEAMKTLEERGEGVPGDGAVFRAGLFPTSHALELQNWYGTLNLNKVKNWVLEYPEGAKLPEPIFASLPFKDAAEFYRTVSGSDYMSQLALSGVRQNNGFGPVASRQILESWVPAYQIYRSQLQPEERHNIDAILLLLGYVHAGEDYMPMQRMLAGHPNFLSDVKSTPSGMAFLFPDHPAADEWADEYEAYLRINSRYHTRPAVGEWAANGGRWTENLGTYVWAFLRPASRAAYLLKSRDGHERLCGPQLIQLGNWLVNALSAPFAGETPETMKRIEAEMAGNEGAQRHYWGIVNQAMGPRRVHPPQGAHSERRKTPRTMWYLGYALRNYSPLTAEHVMWAARPTDQDMEATADQCDTYGVMYAVKDNRGTDPHLQTAKYTGYGIIMRAQVGTPAELSIHLMQIDDGPNYRWGTAGEGGCGEIYFYANGKGYSHNGGEDSGDRIDEDTDFCTNFGVWKDGVFRSVGQNTLSRPHYDLSIAQFAEIVPRQGPRAYSWPEYVGRGILLVGDDYFLIHDRVFNPEIAHRFSWFVRKGDDFPHISLLSDRQRDESNRFTTVETETTTGRWAEGVGDSLVLVTHKEGIAPVRTPFGASVSSTAGTDHIFLTHESVEFREAGKEFAGSAGLIRNREDGTEFALIHGTHIAAGGLSISTSDSELGIGGSITKTGSIRGRFSAPTASNIEIVLPSGLSGARFFIDGEAMEDTGTAERLSVNLPVGTHRWEVSAGMPVPMAPVVDHTENLVGGAVVYGKPVASATQYVLEISVDNAATWTHAGRGPKPEINLTDLKNRAKYHVRFRSRNAEQSSDPGPEYPLYITSEAPPPPDGLHVVLSQGKAEIGWGDVLGVTEYRLYRKPAGSLQFTVAYAGRSTRWTDIDAAIEPAVLPLGLLGTKAAGQGSPSVCEYYVTAVNHIGEGRRSRVADTNPASWRNWNPTCDEPFRRTVELTGGNLPNDSDSRYYPK